MQERRRSADARARQSRLPRVARPRARRLRERCEYMQRIRFAAVAPLSPSCMFVCCAMYSSAHCLRKRCYVSAAAQTAVAVPRQCSANCRCQRCRTGEYETKAAAPKLSPPTCQQAFAFTSNPERKRAPSCCIPLVSSAYCRRLGLPRRSCWSVSRALATSARACPIAANLTWQYDSKQELPVDARCEMRDRAVLGAGDIAAY